MTTRTRNPGEFCWFNLMTPQPAQARGFFGELFGWTYSEIPNVGHTVHLGGHKIGGLFDALAPDGSKLDPHIGVMIKVESADDAVIRARRLGGSARPAFDIMGNLRMSVCTDPEGAVLDFWESKNNHGTDVDPSLHGAPIWIELLTNDVERAVKFYGELFGWTTEKLHSPGMEYTVLKRNGEGLGGMFKIRPDMGAMKPQWVTYFTVDDTDETARKAERLGGKVCMPAVDIPMAGRIAGIASPQGVTLYLIKPMPR